MQEVAFDVHLRGEGQRPSLASARLGLVLVGLVILLVLVALASHPSGTLAEASPTSMPPSALLRLPLLVLTGVCVAMGVSIGIVLWPGRRRKRRPDDPPEWVYQPPPVHWAERLILIATPFLLTAGAVAGLVFLAPAREVPPPPAALPAAGDSRTPPPLTVQPPASSDVLGLGYDWRLGVLVLAVLLAAGAALLLARRRGRHPRASAARAGAFAVALDDTLDALRREGDPRRAVIAAYAMMERVLAHQGALPRRPAEAPFEYLARILTERNVSRAAVARLTELFERAKFSQHEIAQDMRDEAIDALQVIRSELARPADGHVGG